MSKDDEVKKALDKSQEISSKIENSYESEQSLSNTQNHFDSISKRINEYKIIGSSIADAIQATHKRFENESESIYDMFERVHKAFAETQDTIIKGMVSAIQSLNDSLFSFDFSSLYESIRKTFDAIKIPEFTDEQKDELLESHIKWGEIGWTYLPSSWGNFFDENPTDINSANKEMMSYFTKEEQQKLFDCLKLSSVKKDDLETAIFCFENHKYKPCALILFSLIDGKLIRNQGLQAKGRPVGSGAVKLFKKKIESDDERAFYEIIYDANILACLKAFFQGCPNFKDEPEIINRNFVMHGMTGHAVRKRDCIQLFLLLNNLLLLMDN